MEVGTGQSVAENDADRTTSRGLTWLPGPLKSVEADLADRIANTSLRLNDFGYDPYGFHPEAARRLLLPAALLYRYWFRVETHEIGRVPRGPVLLIGNHSGQFGYDGAMLGMAMLLDAQPPRLVRGMAEYIFWRTPFAGTAASRMGTLVGTTENCVAMLREGGCVAVFPEGARGANKPFQKRYQLQRFGLGFLRIALESRAPIVPVGIVGAEEQQPGLANLESFGHKLGLPSFPITITQPWLGLLGSAMALPVKYHLHFGEPLLFDGDADDEDDAVQRHVDVVKDAIAGLIRRGLAQRRGIFT
jgi:1-acyl-sn-glycerol-3-phosphate acyltransferase